MFSLYLCKHHRFLQFCVINQQYAKDISFLINRYESQCYVNTEILKKFKLEGLDLLLPEAVKR